MRLVCLIVKACNTEHTMNVRYVSKHWHGASRHCGCVIVIEIILNLDTELQIQYAAIKW